MVDAGDTFRNFEVWILSYPDKNPDKLSGYLVLLVRLSVIPTNSYNRIA